MFFYLIFASKQVSEVEHIKTYATSIRRMFSRLFFAGGSVGVDLVQGGSSYRGGKHTPHGEEMERGFYRPTKPITHQSRLCRPTKRWQWHTISAT